MSAKTHNSQQQGRRTPLSLSGAKQQQQQLNKASNSNNSNAVKNDNKTGNQRNEQATAAAAVTQIKEVSQKDIRKQQNIEKKQQQQQQTAAAIEVNKKDEKSEEKKTQNGVGKSNGNAKEKHTQNANENKVNENCKEKKEKAEKIEKHEKPLKDDKKDSEAKKYKDKDKEEVKTVEIAVKDKQDEKELEKPNTVVEVSTPGTPAKPTNDNKKASNTPTKPVEKSKSVTPKKPAEKNATPAQDTDIEMETLACDPSPVKAVAPQKAVATMTTKPVATSTPGKALLSKRNVLAKSELQLATQVGSGGSSPDRSSCPRNFSQISGRRSIRPLNEYTPSYFQSNSQFRESYRRINTELDVTSTTNNTSMNVTVGSEVPNNSSFSFFGRGRKRDRTPPAASQSAMELQTDGDMSPPKRARLDMHGFFSAVASPLTLLRSRFAKTTIQSSTPVKLSSKLSAEDEGEVQNVSGISIEEEVRNGDGEDVTPTAELTVGVAAEDETSKKDVVDANNTDAVGNAEQLQSNADEKCNLEKGTAAIVDGENTDDIKFTETPLAGGGNDAKSKRCNIM